MPEVVITQVLSNEIAEGDVISFEGAFYKVVSEPLWGEAYNDPLSLVVIEVAVSPEGEVYTLSKTVTMLHLTKRGWRPNNTAYFLTYLRVEIAD